MSKDLYTLVFNHFKDDDKTNLWFETPNPNLGNVTPNFMIKVGRIEKLRAFIENQLDENTPASSEPEIYINPDFNGEFHCENLTPAEALRKYDDEIANVEVPKPASNADKLWCAMCGKHGDHRSGKHFPKPSNADSVDELAEKFHECYERLAPQFNYETTQASRTDWANVPENNKKLMRAVCKEVVADTITQLKAENEHLTKILDAFSDGEKIHILEVENKKLKAENKAQANEIAHLSKQYLELLSETAEAKISREVN